MASSRLPTRLIRPAAAATAAAHLLPTYAASVVNGASISGGEQTNEKTQEKGAAERETQRAAGAHALYRRATSTASKRGVMDAARHGQGRQLSHAAPPGRTAHVRRWRGHAAGSNQGCGSARQTRGQWRQFSGAAGRLAVKCSTACQQWSGKASWRSAGVALPGSCGQQPSAWRPPAGCWQSSAV